eukprot:CAMPEP_0115505282 /NCGR_PEP_ID=MMETSP0271-20121206/70478_1 /TAXON_ID=71861 /ORGANISM="Scrippsiella trochoidea, Strain CCMP3099" /LENGTH=521 /DNA_ID=CAMNT_0002934533 /DNA_START=1 /DNA_END=1566 /DNA_ORIENTATION=+
MSAGSRAGGSHAEEEPLIDVPARTHARRCMKIACFSISSLACLLVVVGSMTSSSGLSPRASFRGDHSEIVASFTKCPKDVSLKLGQSDQRLNYAFKVDPNEPFFLKWTQPIFDLSYGSEVSTQNLSNYHEDSIEATSIEDFAKAVSSKVSVSGSYGGFGLAFEGAASLSTASMNRKKCKVYRRDVMQVAKARQVTMLRIGSRPDHYLTKDARKYLLESPPSKIYAELGSFFATELILGGIYQSSNVAEMTAQETMDSVHSKVEAKLRNPAGSLSTGIEGKINESSLTENTKVYQKWTVRGGDSIAWLSAVSESKADKKAVWADTFTQDNMGIVQHTLEPIWSLLNESSMNPKKAAELKDYITRKWEEDRHDVPLWKPINQQADDSTIRATWARWLCIAVEGHSHNLDAGSYLILQDCAMRDPHDSEQWEFHSDFSIRSKVRDSLCLRAEDSLDVAASDYSWMVLDSCVGSEKYELSDGALRVKGKPSLCVKVDALWDGYYLYLSSNCDNRIIGSWTRDGPP